MTPPSTAAVPANKILHQDFADIFSPSLFVKPRPVWSGSPTTPRKIAATHKRVIPLETNAVTVWQQCEIKSARGDGAAATVTSPVVIEEGFAAVQESGSGPKRRSRNVCSRAAVGG
jgi:hypothetical protein